VSIKTPEARRQVQARRHGLVLMGLAVATVGGGCTALDSFDFRFAKDGGADLAIADAQAPDAQVGGPDLGGLAFGAPCASGDTCKTYVAGKPLTCLTEINGQQLPDGICTRTCTPGVTGCADFVGVGQGAECVTISGQPLCLPRCNTPINADCRKSWSCCNGATTSSVGDCAPSNSDVCR